MENQQFNRNERQGENRENRENQQRFERDEQRMNMSGRGQHDRDQQRSTERERDLREPMEDEELREGADWGDVDPQHEPGQRSSMDPSGPGSAV